MSDPVAKPAAQPTLRDMEAVVVDGAEEVIAEGRGRLEDPATVTVTPYQSRPLLPTAPRQQARFWKAFDALLERAFREDPGQIRYDREEAEQGALMDAACILCQGQCCLNGGPNNAFLEVEDIQRFRIRNPGAKPEDVRAAYRALMPDETSVMSCVFHGPMGCTLPRAMRSQLCNSFVCRAQNILSEGRRAGNPSAILLAAPQATAVRAATWDAEHGFRRLGQEDTP